MKTVLFFSWRIVAVSCLAAAVYFFPDDPGTSVAFLGFIGKAIKTVKNIAGGVIGIGGGSGKAISIQTRTDPNLTRTIDLLTAQTRLLTQRATTAKTGGFFTQSFGGVPMPLILGGGAVLLFFMFGRKRRR